jgi:Flp pilus assembly protein TadG
MTCAFLMPLLRRAVRRFGADQSGNIAVLFGIAIIPILAFVGAAVDYSRANAARSSMQAALDATALMLSKDLSAGTITASDIPTKATAYFKALYTSTDAQNVQVNATYTTATSSAAATILLNASGQITTEFMNIVGFPTMGFNTNTTTTWGNVKMRVALVLDNTGSMSQNNKLVALKNAVAGSGGLIDQLSNLAKNPGDVYISIVPFAKTVNVGSSNYNQSWIDWTDWLNPPTTQPNNGSYQASLPINWHAVGPTAKCPFTNSNGGFTCVASPGSTSNQSYIASSGTYTGYICPSVDANSHTLYNGCWVSTAAGSGVFCSGTTSCSCPVNSSGNPVSGCSCGYSNGVYQCTGNLYDHNWTQPGPNDTTHNTNQPRVSAVVGWTNRKYTTTNPTPTVVNAWNQASTNPIDTWSGCITDRSQPNDATGAQPTSSDVTTLFPANEYYENSKKYCSSSSSPELYPITPLSYDWTSLKNSINSMQPTGGTNQAVGLAWGWQSLIPAGVLNAPTEDATTTYNRVIIILSDGLNTEDRWPAYGNGSTQASGNPIDVRQAQLCTNLKNTRDSKGNYMYTIYAIQVNTSTPADATSTVLQNCASGSDKFFMLTSSTEILTTFQTIGTALSKLRVAR